MSPSRGGLSQPVVIAEPAELDRVRRHQAALLQLGAEVLGLRVSDDGPRIALRYQSVLDELVKAELLRTRYLDDAVNRRALTRLAHRSRDVVGCHRLKQNMG